MVDADSFLSKNLAQGRLVNGSLGRVLCFATCAEARKQGLLNSDAMLKEPSRLDVKSRRDRQRLQEVPEEPVGFWPVVQFTNTQKVIFTPMPFDTEDAFGDLEATREQASPFCLCE